MKNLNIFSLFKIMAVAGVFGLNAMASGKVAIPHMDLDMTGPEYRELLEKSPRFQASGNSVFNLADPLTRVLNVGKRNLDWIAKINASRPEGQKLELSTPATQVGYPISSPSIFNREIVSSNFSKFLVDAPALLVQVWTGSSELSETIGLSDEEFIVWARKLDRLYQTASRWLMQEPSLAAYAARASADVRGYYFLANQPQLEQSLLGWSTLESSEFKQKLSEALVGICINNGKSRATCSDELQSQITSAGHPLRFKNQYWRRAENMFKGYYTLKNPRPDAKYIVNGDAEALIADFKKPEREDVLNWFRDNVEDEWRFGNWSLKIRFLTDSFFAPKVVFEPGTTPHVNGLGGNTITMDANRSIDEYSSKWTIRHEYGHVLGFPDCYVEFYDSSIAAMVNYQIDVEDLMCSRKGHIKEHHVKEIKRAYARN